MWSHGVWAEWLTCLFVPIDHALGDQVALEPKDHPVHAYVDKELRLQDTLFQRLCKLTAPEFENLLHPVFQEDELTLIVAGGVLGAFAGFLQMSLGWGGPSAEGAVAKALRLSAGAGAGAAATKMALLPPQLLARLARAMPKRKACPSLDADPCGIGLLYLTADEVNMIREKLDQMKRARISGWEWVLEATDTQRCASTKRGLDTKETPAKEVMACPLDQQGRDYMLDLIVQISEDHKRRLFESYREIAAWSEGPIMEVVAAVVGYGTNWVGVKMIFYPIEFLGVNIRRWPETPLGFIGWQGIVPCKTGKMSRRLVDIITEKLLSLKEAFSRLDAAELAQRLEPSVAYAIEHDAAWGEVWISVTRPQLRSVLTQLEMQKDIENLLDLRKVVSSAFLKDKVLLGELFQKAGRKELEFLVNSGLSFGFFLGILQMLLWICFPNNWVLPVGGALVGYITNWVAIKLIFDPVEPTQVGPFVFQGLFEKRQVEVSQEFSERSAAPSPLTSFSARPQPPMLRAALVVAALAVAAAAADADCEEFSTLVAKQEKNDPLHTETKNDLMLLSSSGSSRYQVIFTDADAQELSSFLEGCHQIFLDVGSNRGTHKYKGARYLKVFERVFGPPSERQRNSSGICAIGFEPNSKWIPHHQDIERAYAKQGWKAKFFPVAVSDHVGRINNTVPSGIRLVKMDIEGSEYEVLPDLLQKRMLCHDTWADMAKEQLTIEWHSRFAELSNEKNKQLEKEVHSHNCSGSVPQTMVQNIDDESFMNDGQPLP
eukprot:g21573.t1